MNLIYSNRASAIIYNFIKQYNTGVYLLPANICYIVPITFVKAGVKFEFVDINPITFCIDENAVYKKINENIQTYSGLIYVHTYGAIQNVDFFFNKIKSLNQKINIIDDRCLCVPNFSVEHSLADLVLFSTGYGKYANIGYGSFAFLKQSLNVLDDNELFDEKSILGIESQIKECFIKNFKYTEVCNTWLNSIIEEKLPNGYLNNVKEFVFKVTEHKIRINAIYNKNLPKHIQMGNHYNSWRYNILVSNKVKVLDNIFKAGLFASSHYIPSSRLFDDKYYLESENLFSNVINLFNDFNFSEKNAIQICEIINDNL